MEDPARGGIEFHDTHIRITIDCKHDGVMLDPKAS